MKQFFSTRFNYLFRSTKGLALVGIAMISLVTAIWGMLSGPMAEWGVRDVVVNLLNMELNPFEREGRIIMLYHSISMTVVAIEVYFITDIVSMKKSQQTTINAIVTFGYLFSLIFGMGFAYFGHNFAFHGLFIFGQSLMFFGGIMLSAALWPWKKETYIEDKQVARTRKGLDLERAAFFAMAIATLGSVLFGAIPGSNFGNGFETFMAEDMIRVPEKTPMQLAVIGHLHIMLTLIAVALTLIIGKWVGFKGILHKIAMPMMICGIIVITAGVWAVVPFEPIAHVIIYGGSVLVMMPALLLVIFTWDRQIRLGLQKKGIEKGNFFQKIAALVHDPLPFGATWQMVFMNFTVSGVGIFMAVRLDEIIRVWPAREERITLTGHWHILSGIIATIMLFYFADLAGLKGKARKWFGWLIIIMSDLAFGAVTVFSLKRLFVSEISQQPLVDTTIILGDIGLGTVLVILAIFMIWRLQDLFRQKGRWSEELDVYEQAEGRSIETLDEKTENNLSGREA
ncbi:MAG: hypothetical protein JEZ06_14500 [Anaerolineaceae bacterium]|nr:hypothetical protein [Anaerolineaceae bacterium]